MCVLSIKMSIRKKSGNLFNDPRIWFKKNNNNPLKKIGHFCLTNMMLPWQLQWLVARFYVGVMARKGYFSFPKLLNWSLTIQWLSAIPRTLNGLSFLSNHWLQMFPHTIWHERVLPLRMRLQVKSQLSVDFSFVPRTLLMWVRVDLGVIVMKSISYSENSKPGDSILNAAECHIQERIVKQIPFYSRNSNITIIFSHV